MKIIDYIKENKTLLIIILILLVVVFISILYSKNLKDKNKIIENNIIAATEKIDSLELANGQLLYEKQSYVLSLEDCEKILNITKKELKDIQRKLDSKLLYISELEGEISVIKSTKDTTFIYKYNTDSTYNFTATWKEEPWWCVSSSLTLEDGKLNASLNSLNVNVPLNVGLTDDWTIFVTSPNPYVNFSSIEGAVLDKDTYLKQQKQPKWSFGISGGLYGGYDLIHKSFFLGPGFGFSISYNFFNW